MSNKVEFIGIESDPEKRTVTLIVDKYFDSTLLHLRKADKFLYGSDSNNKDFTELKYLSDKTICTYEFQMGIDTSFLNDWTKPYKIMLKEIGTDRLEEVDTFFMK